MNRESERCRSWCARRRWVEVSGPPTLLGCSGCGCRHRELHDCRAALRRRPCRGGHRRLAQVASVSGAGFALLAIGNCLPPSVIPALFAFASPSPPFRKCHMLPCLLATMVVFPLFLHIFIHVLYLTCFQHPCVLAHLDRAYPVSGSAPMSPRHILPRFSFSFYRHCMLLPRSFTFPCILCFGSFLLFLLRYPLTICFVRYLHCGVQLAMTPLPSLPSSHRFTSTSQIHLRGSAPSRCALIYMRVYPMMAEGASSLDA